MKIAAHRGFWLQPQEKNSLLAFERALQAGFGIETDVRDAGGVAVISHDMPRGGEMTLDAFLALCHCFPQARPLALNIKADGQQALVAEALEQHSIGEAFVFDMAVPDALGYLKLGVPCYTRASEIEQPPSYLERAAGVWLDAFEGQWYDAGCIKGWLDAGQAVCIVSPELHGRAHLDLWQMLRHCGLHRHALLTLCTDFPQQAKDFFHD
jgi:hypothetical protein